jgi:hypothetical protein
VIIGNLEQPADWRRPGTPPGFGVKVDRSPELLEPFPHSGQAVASIDPGVATAVVASADLDAV